MSRESTRIGLLIVLLATAGAVAYWWSARDTGPTVPTGGDLPHEQPANTAPLAATRPTPQHKPDAEEPPPREEPSRNTEPEAQAAISPGVLTGRVVDSGGAPLERVQVFAIVTHPGLSTTSDADGCYQFKLSPGNWRLLAQTGQMRILGQPGEAVVVSGETTTAADFVLGAPVTVTARLLDASGNTLGDKDRTGRAFHVFGVFTSPDGYVARRQAEVDAQGFARFDRVPVDARELVVNAIGYMISATTHLSLVEGQVNDAGDVRLTPMDSADAPPSGSARGRVIDPEGKPLQGIVLFAHRTEDKEKFAETYRSDDRTETDAEGAFRFAALEVGEWYFIVASSEYTVRVNPGSVAVTQDNEASLNGDFVLGPPTSYAIRLLDERGNPLKAGLRVTGVFRSKARVTRLVREVDAEGRVSFRGAPADAHEFLLIVPGYTEPEATPIRLTEGETTDGGDTQLNLVD